MTGTPADMGGGAVVRVRLGGGLVYSSARMCLTDARRTCEQVAHALDSPDPVLRFPSGTHDTVLLPARAVRAVEVARVDGAAR